jgi:hypothetical protein
MEGRCRYGRGSGGGAQRDGSRTGGAGATSDRRREMKEERAELAAKARWAGFRNGK